MEDFGDELVRMDRRTAVKWMFAAAAAFSACTTFDEGRLPSTAPVGAPALTPADPDLFNAEPWWDRTLTPEQLRTVRTLCDVVIPKDEHSASAGEIGVADFIDEWISAPYEPQRGHRARILDGITWIDAESRQRFGGPFHELTDAEKARICDDICYLPRAQPNHREAARFFALFRDLTASGFYTTPEGMADLKYMGNVPLPSFTGPPLEVLRRLGLS
jgi:hypothetical protein